MAVFPTNIKTWEPRVNISDSVVAADVNELYLEVTELETQLGQGGVLTNDGWSGTFSSSSTSWTSLRARLQNLDYGVKKAVDGSVDTAGGSTITPSSASVIGLTIKGAASQSANLLEIKNSSNAVLAKFEPDGKFTALVIDGGTA